MGKTVCEGIVIPLITPFDDAGEVDEPVLREMTEFMARSGVHGLFILGSAGQGPVMTVAQRKRAAEAVCLQVRERVPVVTHVGCADTESTVELALHAKTCGTTAIAVVPPFYYSDHSDQEIIDHVRAVAAAAGEEVPIYLYDNPRYTGIHLTPERVRQYVEAVPSVCGIKAAYIGAEELLRYVHLAPPAFGVFSGSIFNLLATVPLGVTGAIHPPTSFFPELCVGLWEAIRREQWKEAFDFQRVLFELTTAIGSFKEKGRAALAAIARLRGFAVQRYPRWKTESLSASQIQTLERALEKAGIALRAV